MNRFVYTLIMFFATTLLFSACKKSTVDTSEAMGKMDAIVTGNKWTTGNAWSSSAAVATGTMGQTPYGYTKTLLIVANKTSGTAFNGVIVLSIDNYKDTATTFYLDNVNNTAKILEIEGSDTTIHYAATGVINITQGTNKTAYGYFNFTTSDNVLVNNGIFNVTIPTP